MFMFYGVYDACWHHNMENIFTLLARCEGNPLVTSGFPSQKGPVMQGFDVLAGSAIEQIVEMPVIWHTITLMQHHFNNTRSTCFHVTCAPCLNPHHLLSSIHCNGDLLPAMGRCLPGMEPCLWIPGKHKDYNFNMAGHISPWRSLMGILALCPILKWSYCYWFEDRLPIDFIYWTRSSTELQRLYYMTGYQDSGLSNDCRVMCLICISCINSMTPGKFQ